MNHIIKQFYKFDKNIQILTIISFLARIILLSVLPFIPFLSQNNEYITNLLISSLLTGDILGGLIIGILSDKTDKHKIVLFSIIILIIVSIALLFNLSNIKIKLIIFFILGTSIASININSMALSTLLCNEFQKKIFFYYRYWINNLATIIGIIIGFLSISFYEKKNIIYIIIFSLSIIIFLLLFAIKNNKDLIRNSSSNIDLKYLSLLNKILPFLWINFFIMITHQQLTTNLPLYLKSYTINGANIYFIILLINTLITMMVIKNFEKQNIFLLLLMPIGMFLFQYINLFPILIIATIIYSIGEFFFFPYITYNAEKNMPDKLKSTSFALLNIARFGLGIGGLLGEYVVKKFGYNILFILSATIQFIIILYTINLIKKQDC